MAMTFQKLRSGGLIVTERTTDRIIVILEPGALWLSTDTGNLWRIREIDHGFQSVSDYSLNTRVTVERAGMLRRDGDSLPTLDTGPGTEPDGSRESHEWSVAVFQGRCMARLGL